jgi:hypothetical protein
MAVDEIRQVVLNPLTGLPLTKKGMYRHFPASWKKARHCSNN